MIYKIWVDGIPKGPNFMGRKHWSIQSAHKKEWQEKIGWLAKVKKPKQPFQKARIHFAIKTGDTRKRDPDNLNWAITKPSLDALKGIFIEDDSLDNVELSYEYSQEKPKGFEIQIEEI